MGERGRGRNEERRTPSFARTPAPSRPPASTRQRWLAASRRSSLERRRARSRALDVHARARPSLRGAVGGRSTRRAPPCLAHLQELGARLERAPVALRVPLHVGERPANRAERRRAVRRAALLEQRLGLGRTHARGRDDRRAARRRGGPQEVGSMRVLEMRGGEARSGGRGRAARAYERGREDRRGCARIERERRGQAMIVSSSTVRGGHLRRIRAAAAARRHLRRRLADGRARRAQRVFRAAVGAGRSGIFLLLAPHRVDRRGQLGCCAHQPGERGAPALRLGDRGRIAKAALVHCCSERTSRNNGGLTGENQ